MFCDRRTACLRSRLYIRETSWPLYWPGRIGSIHFHQQRSDVVVWARNHDEIMNAFLPRRPVLNSAGLSLRRPLYTTEMKYFYLLLADLSGPHTSWDHIWDTQGSAECTCNGYSLMVMVHECSTQNVIQTSLQAPPTNLYLNCSVTKLHNGDSNVKNNETPFRAFVLEVRRSGIVHINVTQMGVRRRAHPEKSR